MGGASIQQCFPVGTVVLDKIHQHPAVIFRNGRMEGRHDPLAIGNFVKQSSFGIVLHPLRSNINRQRDQGQGIVFARIAMARFTVAWYRSPLPFFTFSRV